MKHIQYGRQFIDNKDIKLVTKSLSNYLTSNLFNIHKKNIQIEIK
jgi:hypothetical protein